MQLSELPGCSGEPQDNNGVSKVNVLTLWVVFSRQVAVEDHCQQLEGIGSS